VDCRGRARRAAAAWRLAPTPAASAAAAAARGWRRHARGAAAAADTSPNQPDGAALQARLASVLYAPWPDVPRCGQRAAGGEQRPPPRVSAAAARRPRRRGRCRPTPCDSAAVGGETAGLCVNPAGSLPSAPRAPPRGWAAACNEKPTPPAGGAVTHVWPARGAHERDGTRGGGAPGRPNVVQVANSLYFWYRGTRAHFALAMVDLRAGPSSGVGLHTTPLFRGRQGRATDKTPY